MRDGFIIHEKTLKQMQYLEPEDKGFLMNLLTRYYFGESVDLDKVENVSPIVAVIFIDASERMDADASAYDEAAERRVNSAKKAAAARWSKGCDEDAENAVALNRICDEDAENAVSVSVSDSVSVSGEEKREYQREKPSFSPPSLEQVREHVQEKGYHFSPEAFVSFYDSNGWKVGKNKMKDWRAAARTWENREKSQRDPPREKPKKPYEIEQRTRTKEEWAELEKMLLTGGKV